MTREEILNSNALKRRFIKDCNLPISVTENPYFMERLRLQNIFMDATGMFDIFCESLKDFNNEQEYFEYYNGLKESMMEDIKTDPDFQKFLTLDIVSEKNFSKGDLYKDYNDDCLFISIDMIQANFSVLNFFYPSIFGDCSCWEDFISQYTNNEHIINSKYIRQVVLGNCNPKKQIRLEDILMNTLARYISNQFPDLDIYSVHNDEILIKAKKNGNGIDSFSISRKELEEALKNEPSGIGKIVRVEIFELHKIPGTDGWIQEEYGHSNKVKFKCLDSDLYTQYVKYYYNIPIIENDKVFRHNHRLAMFLEEVENPWKE